MSNTSIARNWAEAKRQETAAKEKAERRKVSPDVRAARAALLDRREALQDAEAAAAKVEREAAPDALRSVLSRGTVAELAEIARMISRFDGRRLQALVDEVFRERARTQSIGGTEMPLESAERPARIRGRAKATSAA